MRRKILIIIAIIFLVVIGKLVLGLAKFSPVFFQLLFHKEISLKKANHNVNILILGIGGGSHEGPDLTDTIMFASIDESKNKISLVSIPRDFWVSEIKGKINSVYSIGESQKKGGGLILTKAVVSKILNKTIDYGIVVDFDGFVKAVDLVGGLDIVVDRSFDDYQYPDEEKREDLCGHTLEEATLQIATMPATEVFPCRYQHIHFDEGLQHISGERALVFVRSRYAIGPEGSDFARNRRQQKVIQAFKDKALSLGILLNPIKITNLYSVLENSIVTDIKALEFDDFVRLANRMKKASIYSAVIDVEDVEQNKKGLLVNPPLADFSGAWVLIPKAGNGNFKEIQEYVKCVLVSNDCQID